MILKICIQHVQKGLYKYISIKSDFGFKFIEMPKMIKHVSYFYILFIIMDLCNENFIMKHKVVLKQKIILYT